MRGRRARRVDRESGISIPEVLVTTLLLAIGVGAVAATLGAAGEATAAGSRRSTATELADSELEAVRSLAYDEVGISPASPGYVSRFEGSATVTNGVNLVAPLSQVTADGITYTIRRQVTWGAIRAGTTRIAEGYKRVTVIITWADGTGSHELRLDTGLYEAADG